MRARGEDVKQKKNSTNGGLELNPSQNNFESRASWLTHNKMYIINVDQLNGICGGIRRCESMWWLKKSLFWRERKLWKTQIMNMNSWTGLNNFKNAHILCTEMFELHVFDRMIELIRRHRINSFISTIITINVCMRNAHHNF